MKIKNAWIIVTSITVARAIEQLNSRDIFLITTITIEIKFYYIYIQISSKFIDPVKIWHWSW
jgi:hypothetical protein